MHFEFSRPHAELRRRFFLNSLHLFSPQQVITFYFHSSIYCSGDYFLVTAQHFYICKGFPELKRFNFLRESTQELNLEVIASDDVQDVKNKVLYEDVYLQS